MEEIKSKKKNGKKERIKFLIFSLVLAFVLSIFTFNQLFFVTFSVKPKWLITRTNLSITLSENPEFLELRSEEIEKELAELINPASGVYIPVMWGDLGSKMIEAGIIDKEKFYSLHEKRGGFGEYEKNLLEGTNNGKLFIDSENAGTILNLLWALGLSNKNEILESGPIQDEKYGGEAGNFASTGGWSLSRGKTMDHFSAYNFIELTGEQQKLVEEVSRNIYRPCCGNSTYFPDCNHGMAMLGLMELMASQGATEQEMYDTALAVNSFWFPSTYTTIGKYFAKRGISWENIDAKQILGSSYSSAQGYSQIASEVEPAKSGGGASCGV